jgi:hypothetical protein
MHAEIESPEEMVAKYGYTLDQAKQVHTAFLADQGTVRPLNLRTFQLAQKYYESAKVLEGHIPKASNANVAPGLILCMSLALVLFFKTLVILDRDDLIRLDQMSKKERDSYFIHEIPALYDVIPEHYKDKLAVIYSARMGVARLPHDRFRSELVEKANDIFVEWRYVHEEHGGVPKHLNLGVLENLIVSAQLVTIESKNPG